MCDAQYLAGYLLEIGPSVAGSVITHSEIESWQSNTGIELSAWEARTLRRLSSEYLKQQHDATAIDCPAPNSTPETQQKIDIAKRERVRNNIRSLAVT